MIDTKDIKNIEKDIEKEIEREHRKHKRIVRFLEFFVVGFLFGIAEDLLVVFTATDARITFHVVVIAAIIALPFAIFSELIFDKPETRRYIRRRVFHPKHHRHRKKKRKK